MFIVYSPEGQSFIGAVQNLPVLKVDPAKRINKVDETDLDALKTDVKGQEKHTSRKSGALDAYKGNQQESKRAIVVKVSEIMVSPVITVGADNTLEEAWNLMKTNSIKHLPVLDHTELVGMCSQSDLLGRIIVSKSGELEGVKPERVRDVMQSEVVTTSLDTDIRHIAQALTGYQIDALVIMNEYRQILGIVSESDLIRRLAKEPPIELYI